MTVPTPETFPLGPGTLKVGATGSLVDVSCLVNNAVVAADKEQGDSETKLCGTVVPGSVTYTWTLSGNVDLDIATDSGLWDISQTMAGTQVDFEYTPNTEAGTKATGKVVIDPLPLGGDETGTTMAADFEWTVVGVPTYSQAAAGVLEFPAAVMASSGAAGPGADSAASEPVGAGSSAPE